MGRPPIGTRKMTPTERQRRWRHRKAQTVEPSPHEAVDQGTAFALETETEPPAIAQPTADGAYAELRRERDQAVRERNQVRHELEEAREQRDAALRAGLPQPEVVGDHMRICWCSFCGKRWGDHPRLGLEKSQVEIMIAGSIGHRTFICNECVEKFSVIVAEKRQREGAEPRQ